MGFPGLPGGLIIYQGHLLSLKGHRVALQGPMHGVFGPGSIPRFLLGLVMVTALALKPRSINSAQVEEAVELQSEDPVWKQVLGNQAYKQYEDCQTELAC